MNLWLNQYPLSAHVVQHFLLALVIPALIVLATPAFDLGPLHQIERIHVQPTVCWTLGVGTMLAWHIPVLFNAAVASDGLHIFQQLCFLISGTVFWWPILGPRRDRRLQALPAVAYLFSACVFCSLLGAFLTFGPVGLYSTHPGHGALDPKDDQQLAGLLMWVPGCFVYLSAILVTVRRWYSSPSSNQTSA
jgi:putative membrane protein